MKAPLIGLVVAGLLTSCAGDGGGAMTTAPSNPDEVVLTVTSEGGFVPVEFNLERMPRFLLTAGGTLYYQGPVPMIFPGPLLPNVQVTSVDRATFDEIMGLVDELGLPDIDERIDDSGAEMVADASTEFITFYDEEGPHRLGIYALGMVEGGGASIDRILATEVVQLLDAASAAGESTEYRPDRLQVAAGPPLGFEEEATSVEDWPLEVPYADMEAWGAGWSCVEVGGSAVEGLLETFGAATQATLWDTGDEEVSIRARPLLPGETACGGEPATG